MVEMYENSNKKKIIGLIVIAVIVITIIVIGLVVYNNFRNQKLKREKEERAAELKAEDFLNEIYKESLKETVSKNCNVAKKKIYEKGFSWVGNDGTPQYMNGKNLNIFFSSNGSKCCGNISKFWEQLKTHFDSHEFTENEENSNRENYIYAFENDGLKCIYGYKDVLNGETFCQFGIVCGRINESLTNDDFQNIFYLFSKEKPYKTIVIDNLAETIYGKFAKGKTGPIFFFDVGDYFVAKKDESGTWKDMTYLIKEKEYNFCRDLLKEKIPPTIAKEKCYNDYKMLVDYGPLYRKEYK